MDRYIELNNYSYVSNNKVHVWSLTTKCTFRTFEYNGGWKLLEQGMLGDEYIRIQSTSDINSCNQNVYSSNIKLLNKAGSAVVVDIKEGDPQKAPMNDYNNATTTGNYYVSHQNAISNGYVDNIEGVLSVSNAKGFIKQELSSLDGTVNVLRIRGANGWTEWKDISPEIDLSDYATKEDLQDISNFKGAIGQDSHPKCFLTAPARKEAETGYIRMKTFENVYRVYYFEGINGVKYYTRGTVSGETLIAFNLPTNVAYRCFEYRDGEWKQITVNYIQILDTVSGDWKKNVYSSTQRFWDANWKETYMEPILCENPLGADYDDYNEATSTGDYYVIHTESIANAPIEAVEGILTVRNANGIIKQELTSNDGSINLYRVKGQEWTEWKSIASSTGGGSSDSIFDNNYIALLNNTIQTIKQRGL